MADYPDPDIPLAVAKAAVLAGSWHIRSEAQRDALALSADLSPRLCLLSLVESDFHKSMDAEEPKWQGCRQDVYKPCFGGFDLYVKYQWFPKKGSLFVVSFKEQW